MYQLGLPPCSLWNIVAPVAVLEAILRPSSARHASASIQRLLAFSVLTSVTAELRLRGPKIKKISEFLILFVHPPNLHSLQRLFGVILKNFHRKKIVSTNLLLVFIALELDLVRFLGKIYRCKRRRNFTFSNWSLREMSFRYLLISQNLFKHDSQNLLERTRYILLWYQRACMTYLNK